MAKHVFRVQTRPMISIIAPRGIADFGIQSALTLTWNRHLRRSIRDVEIEEINLLFDLNLGRDDRRRRCFWKGRKTS